MATKYLTLRAELVETGEQDCDKCMFSHYVDWWLICGISEHPKFNETNCETGYWKEINLTK